MLVPDCNEKALALEGEELSDLTYDIPINDTLASNIKLVLSSEFFGGSSALQPQMHVTLPKTVKHICFDGMCRRTLCPVSAASGSVEDLTSIQLAPRNYKILFDLGPNASG